MIKELSRPHILRSEENEAVHSHSCHRMPILLPCLFLMKTALMSPPMCAYMHIYVSNTSVKSKPGHRIGRKNATLLKISWLIDIFTNCKGYKWRKDTNENSKRPCFKPHPDRTDFGLLRSCCCHSQSCSYCSKTTMPVLNEKSMVRKKIEPWWSHIGLCLKHSVCFCCIACGWGENCH